MKLKLPILLSLITLIVTSCSSDAYFIDSLWINSEKMDVESVTGGTLNCYQAQENEFVNESDWRSLCQGIEGFDDQYETGYIYNISVIKTDIKNPPQDGSSVSYKLKEILSKELN